jgi:two-component system sensor histidine kinase BaeS
VRSLRTREFVAIAVAVVISVAVTLVVAVVLVRRSAHQEALRSLARQAALIAAQQRAVASGGPSTRLGRFFDTPEEGLAIVTVEQAARLLPPPAGSRLRAGKPVQGSLTLDGRGYLYAADRVRNRAVVLLQHQASDVSPFTIAFVIAAGVGAAIAALAAFLTARAVARPIERVSEASLALARGERPGPLPVEGPTEVAALAAAFNKMADDLDHANAAERSFLLSVSHELKTPLASIRGHGEAILDEVIAVPRAATIVVQEAKRLERLVRDLLDLARLNQRSFTVVPGPIDLAQIAEDAVDRHEAEAVRVGVALDADTDGSAPAFADADRTLQVLSNLIENALRSTPAGGSVTVEARPGLLRVTDTGPGLAADELPRAFERFFLYDRYRTNRAVGTGLGLAIVKELTEAMHGTTTVDGTPGSGAAFTVRLPSVPPGFDGGETEAPRAAAQPVGLDG